LTEVSIPINGLPSVGWPSASDANLGGKNMPAKSKPYTIIHHFPGGTKKQYAASLAAVHPGKNLLPKGQILHAAGPSKGGWTIVATHESKRSWERFRDGVLLPRLKKGVRGGFKTAPEETAFPVYHFHS
jgi:hypothetical protein